MEIKIQYMRTRTHEDKNIWKQRQGLKETGTQGHKNTRAHIGTNI
jgi:hypothetical protein